MDNHISNGIDIARVADWMCEYLAKTATVESLDKLGSYLCRSVGSDRDLVLGGVKELVMSLEDGPENNGAAEKVIDFLSEMSPSRRSLLGQQLIDLSELQSQNTSDPDVIDDISYVKDSICSLVYQEYNNRAA